MRRHQAIGRPVVVVAALSLLVGVSSAWALTASPPSPRRSLTSASSPVAAYRGADAGAERLAAALASRRRSVGRDEQRRPRPALLASIRKPIPITARPGGRKVVGSMPAGSRFYGIPLVAWVLARSEDGRYGKVTVPYSGTRKTGWIRLKGLKLSRTPYSVYADLSRHLVKVMRRGRVTMRFRAATGGPSSPTPPGRYFVTDRVPFDPNGPLGAFAFGISGIQPRLPAGWRGGDQLAIHGTNNPASIGTSASAGCLRVSRRALERLKPVLALGTPVVIVR